jgi:GT2 family glycosyltransferase
MYTGRCHGNKVILVTVTYGRRWHLLRQVLTSALDQGVGGAVVVDNASHDAILLDSKKEFGDIVRVIELPANSGSANGYKVGIVEALKTSAEYLWLMDDDNRPQPGALKALLGAYSKLQATLPADRLALLSFRPEHQPDIAAGVPLHRCYPRPGSFFGFHLFDVPYKLWRRTLLGKPKQRLLPECIPVPAAPYSGFFCHRSVIERIGLPMTELVLYADDTEYTSRLTRCSDGQIFLVPASRIDDLETSWNTKSQFSSSCLGWLCGNSDFRAFYGARNQSHIETMCNKHKIIRGLNRNTYLGVMAVTAVLKKRTARFRLLLNAIRHGETAQLGVDERFPLQ